MLDVIPCTNCEANEVRAELDATEALCEPCQNGVPLVPYDPNNWHRIEHEHCQHPWYHEPVPNNQRSEDLQYKLERNWLLSLDPASTVICLNGLPTTAEERLYTVEDILTNWYGITLGHQVKLKRGISVEGVRNKRASK